MDFNKKEPKRTKTYLISFNIGLFDDKDPHEECQHYPSDLFDNYDHCDQAFMNNTSKGNFLNIFTYILISNFRTCKISR